jgi:hypothetical protein
VLRVTYINAFMFAAIATVRMPRRLEHRVRPRIAA